MESTMARHAEGRSLVLGFADLLRCAQRWRGGSLAEGALAPGGRGEVGQHDAEPPGLIG